MSEKSDKHLALYKQNSRVWLNVDRERRKSANRNSAKTRKGKKRATAEEKAEIAAYLASNQNPKSYNEV